MTGKTLKELNVQVGDVVQYMPLGGITTVAEIVDGRYYGSGINAGNPYTEESGFRIISRATQTLWRDLTTAEKGALLLAHHDGGQLQYMHNSDWVDCNDVFSGHYAYQIKPHIPKTATETFYGHSTKSVQLEWGFSRVTIGFSDTHRITFTTIDGVPDCASVKMEVL